MRKRGFCRLQPGPSAASQTWDLLPVADVHCPFFSFFFAFLIRLYRKYKNHLRYGPIYETCGHEYVGNLDTVWWWCYPKLTSNSWCNRCHKSYGSTQAFEQHLRDSPHHFACPECAFDGWTWDQLLQHFRDDGCRIACRGCNDGGGAHWTSHSNAYWHHVHDENVCTECERHFSSPHNLHQVFIFY